LTPETVPWIRLLSYRKRYLAAKPAFGEKSSEVGSGRRHDYFHRHGQFTTWWKATILFSIDIVENYVDIVFANETEAFSYTGKEPEDALHAIAEECDVGCGQVG